MDEPSSLPESVPDSSKTDTKVERIHGELHRVVKVMDSSGNVVNQFVTPLMIEFQWRDLFQILIGACVLSIPVAFTEEVWDLGRELPLINIVGINALSVLFISLFAYFLMYRNSFRGNEWDFFKRVLAVYLVTFLLAALLLTLFNKAPWGTEPIVAVKRSVLVAFPGCFSATVVDSLR